MLRLIYLTFIVLFTLVGCREPDRTVGEAVDFAATCDEANEGERVAVEGYLRLPTAIARIENQQATVFLRLYETDDFTGTTLGVTTKMGTEPNEVDPVGTRYQDTDLQVHLANGQVATFGTKMKVSGTVDIPSLESDNACTLKYPLIELAD